MCTLASEPMPVVLQRVQFDREQLQAFKSQAYLKFGESISMDRFLENSDPEKKRRSNELQTKLNGCRERIRQLTEAKVILLVWLTVTLIEGHPTAPAIRPCVDRDVRFPIEGYIEYPTRGGRRASDIIGIRSTICKEGA